MIWPILKELEGLASESVLKHGGQTNRHVVDLQSENKQKHTVTMRNDTTKSTKNEQNEQFVGQF